jgi:hypothetical protein
MTNHDQKPKLSRRRLLKLGATAVVSVPTLAALERFAPYQREALAQSSTPSDIQFDIGNFIAPVQTINGIRVQFGPIYTMFVTARLNRTPNRTDQANLRSALQVIEQNFPWSAGGIFTLVSYGRPYFNRLPGGINGSLVSSRIPRLATNTSRSVLEEAVPAANDVPNVTKRTPLFNVPVRIETNDLLFTIRGDSLTNVTDVTNWLGGSQRLLSRSVPMPGNVSSSWTITSRRLMFARRGIPREVADANRLQFANRVNPESPMWMGFVDQQVDGSSPARDVTFVGTPGVSLPLTRTTATAGSYFDNGSIQHLSHVIMDLNQFYAVEGEDGFLGEDETYLERIQYMHHAPPPNNIRGNTDQFSNGGGPAFVADLFLGNDRALRSARGDDTDIDSETGQRERRMGHVSCLHRVRTADGKPIHLRMDGPGFDNMDVPGGRSQPKLQFTVFVPTAAFFRDLREKESSFDLAQQFGVEDADNGLERFLTATRRQNFLCPPRRNRAFPLVEFT